LAGAVLVHLDPERAQLRDDALGTGALAPGRALDAAQLRERPAQIALLELIDARHRRAGAHGRVVLWSAARPATVRASFTRTSAPASSAGLPSSGARWEPCADAAAPSRAA